MNLSVWRLLPFIVFVILAVFLWRGLYLEPQKLPSSELGHPLPEFNLPVLGQPQQSLNPQVLHGQIALLNVWASWCEACVEEQVFLLDLAKQGIPIYGINYKDHSADALHWLQEWGNPYRLIGEDRQGKLAIDLGVYGAPETFLIDEQGVIQYRHAGIVDQQSWQQEFLPRIRQLRKQA